MEFRYWNPVLNLKKVTRDNIREKDTIVGREVSRAGALDVNKFFVFVVEQNYIPKADEYYIVRRAPFPQPTKLGTVIEGKPLDTSRSVAPLEFIRDMKTDASNAEAWRSTTTEDRYTWEEVLGLIDEDTIAIVN